MNKIMSHLGFSLMLISLVGCGLKGPLYFPEPEKTVTDTSSSTADSAEKQQKQPKQSTMLSQDTQNASQ